MYDMKNLAPAQLEYLEDAIPLVKTATLDPIIDGKRYPDQLGCQTTDGFTVSVKLDSVRGVYRAQLHHAVYMTADMGGIRPSGTIIDAVQNAIATQIPR